MASIAVAGVFIYQFSRPQRPERPSPQSQAPASAGLLSPLEIAENFLSAEFSEERLRWIRDPEIHGESVRTTVLPFPLEKLTSIERPIDQSGILELFHAQFRNNRSHLVCVLDENVFGTRAVDWEAFTRQGSSSWGELVTGEVLSAEMRVFVQPLGRADFIFGEVDTPHFKYAITSPDVEGELYGYVVRGTRTGLSLAKETMGQGKAGPRRMTLVLESQNESHTQQQFLITCVVAAGWVKGDTNLEARTILPHEIQR